MQQMYATQAPRRATLGVDIPWGAIVTAVSTIGLALYSKMAEKKTLAKAAKAQKKAEAQAAAQEQAAIAESQKISVEQAQATEQTKIQQWSKVMRYGTLAVFVIGGGTVAWLLTKGTRKQEK